VCSCVFLAFCLVASISAQTPSTAVPSAASVLQSSIQALSGKTVVTDITLVGSAQSIVGSDDETGSFEYKAIVGSNRLDLNLSGGTRSEIRAAASTGIAGNWIGTDAVVHEIADHNLLVDFGWSPIFTLNGLLASATGVLNYVGPETKNGAPVLHLTFQRIFPNEPAASATIWQHDSQIDIYLDPSTFYPVVFDFNIHPDANAAMDIPVEIRFSDYRAAGSLMMPFHIQRYISGSLSLDLQVQTASVNSGVPTSAFAIQ
jgi:hypothetical protein